jgi:hypothetical protein
MNQDDGSDWRLQGQETYLKGLRLIKSQYTAPSLEWDHDHCEFCGQKFSDLFGDLPSGYCTDDRYHWICDNCYTDFKEMFEWTVK